MILIKQTQRTVKVNVTRLKKDAHTILALLGYEDFDLGIWLTTDATIRRYNKQYRHKDKATDILSFSYHPHLKAGERIVVKSSEDTNLGDLIISVPYVQRDAQKLLVTVDDRLRRLLVHGICHLLGYDHENDADYKIMHRKEMSLLKKLPR